MRTLPSAAAEWVQAKDGTWGHPEHPGVIVTLSDGLSLADYLAARERPPEPKVDPRDAKIIELEAAVSALKKSGVLTDTMIDAERATKA